MLLVRENFLELKSLIDFSSVLKEGIILGDEIELENKLDLGVKLCLFSCS